MISITDYNTICQQLADSIEALTSFVLVAEDQHATNKLKDRRGVQLVAAMPSAHRDGKPGRPADNHAALFFILAKRLPDPKEDQELQQYEHTQQIALAIREHIENQQATGCSIFFRLNIDSIIIEPVFNTFGGWNGWSLQIIF